MAKTKKPKLPRRDYPLWPHLSGQWAKKVRQRVWYFGPWSDDPAAAECRWDQEKEFLLRGEIPPTRTTSRAPASPSSCIAHQSYFRRVPKAIRHVEIRHEASPLMGRVDESLRRLVGDYEETWRPSPRIFRKVCPI